MKRALSNAVTAVAASILILFHAVPRSLAQAPTSSVDSVRAAESARGRALLAADTVALSGLIGSEFIEISRRGQVRTRADNLREIATGDLKLSSVRYDSLAVRIYGDVAILTGIADNAGSYRGFQFEGRIRYTRVFVRREGRWQAVLMQQTPIQ